MKRIKSFCRRMAAYLVRENNSLIDILILVWMLRLLDQHRYGDAVLMLLIGAVVQTIFQSIAGKKVNTHTVITNRIETYPSFTKRGQENLNGRG